MVIVASVRSTAATDASPAGALVARLSRNMHPPRTATTSSGIEHNQTLLVVTFNHILI